MTDEQERAHQELIDAVAAWREAPCLRAAGLRGASDGDHVMECPQQSTAELIARA